jgi:hypothetical protein
MPRTGLEPARHFWHWSLKPACLPISAPGLNRIWELGSSRGCEFENSNSQIPNVPNSQIPKRGAERDRTADLLNAIQALSQLSYSPVTPKLSNNDETGLTGLEPATSAVTVRHSNQAELQPQAGNRVRTGDLHVGNVTLYQLSYSRIAFSHVRMFPCSHALEQYPHGDSNPGRCAENAES